MNEDGKNMLNLFKELKEVNGKISLLLQDIEAHMKKEGWEADDSTVMSDTSASVYSPEKWFPCFLFRFYKNTKRKNILAYVSVLLDDDIYGHYNIVDEPLITAGYFEYDKSKDIGEDWIYEYSKWFGYTENHKINGKIKPYKNWKDDFGKIFKLKYEKVYEQIENWECFGLPLTSIANSQDIKTKIVTPLLNILSEK